MIRRWCKPKASDWETQILEKHKNFNGTVVIVGAGAVDFDWTAMELAAQEVTQSTKINSRELSALLVFQMRSFSRVKKTREKKKRPVDGELKIALDERKNLYDAFTKSIAEHTMKATKNAKLRIPTNENALGLLNEEASVFLTLNYDPLLEEHFRGHHVLHLHGTAKAPEVGFILPTEVAMEDYRRDVDRGLIGQIHYAAIVLLQRAKKVVFWGCSLEPTDAEVLVLVGEACRPKAESIEWYSINPCQVPDRRIEYLVGRRPERLWEGKSCSCIECEKRIKTEP